LAHTLASPCLGHEPKVRVVILIEATNHKHYLEEVEVSFPNKTLKIVVVENLKTELASKCKLDFMGMSKSDVLQGARQTKKQSNGCHVTN
jgi:hypothetical protein